jgi:hypothetical protein
MSASVIIIDNIDSDFTYGGLWNSVSVGGFFGTNYMTDPNHRSGDYEFWDPTSNTDWLAVIW